MACRFPRRSNTPEAALSYPYGAHSAVAVRAAAKVGFQLAITCVPVKTKGSVQLGSARALQVGRNKVYGSQPLGPQCAYVRSDVSIRKALQRRRISEAF